jgi:SAM-dependent methyltransferase
VLEIGFGHGRTIARLAQVVPDGVVAGVEISERMLWMAGRFNSRLIERGRVELKLADGAAIPYEAERFDRVLAVHTLYFWPSPADTLREIRRVMKPGGRIVLGFRSAEDGSILRDFPRSVYRFYRCDEVARWLEGAGFHEVRLVNAGGDPRSVVFAAGERDAG